VTIEKPAFPNPSTSLTKATLEKLEGLVKDVRGADGAVDVQALAGKVAASSDAAIKNSFEAIKDAFIRIEVGPRTGCGSSSRRVEPTKLNATEVMSVLAALVDARQKVDGLDANHDGKLQADEVLKASHQGDLSGRLAEASLGGSSKAIASS
jgi:hypothetical protein